MIKAVIFDLGGVLFSDGTDKFLKDLAVITGKTYEELYPIFRKGKSWEYRENKISGKEFFAWAEKELNAGLSGDELNQMWVSDYIESPEVRKIIVDLHNKGLRVSVLSDNVPERVNYLEEKYSFKKLFDDIIFSYEVDLSKTSPAIFELALTRLKIKAEEAIFVDDREVNLKMARKLGIKSILFTSAKQLKNELDEELQAQSLK